MAVRRYSSVTAGPELPSQQRQTPAARSKTMRIGSNQPAAASNWARLAAKADVTRNLRHWAGYE
jgi:hypothetical protein